MRWPLPALCQGGSSFSQISLSLRGQRVWKQQPLGGFSALGTVPLSLMRFCSAAGLGMGNRLPCTPCSGPSPLQYLSDRFLRCLWQGGDFVPGQYPAGALVGTGGHVLPAPCYPVVVAHAVK